MVLAKGFDVESAANWLGGKVNSRVVVRGDCFHDVGRFDVFGGITEERNVGADVATQFC